MKMQEESKKYICIHCGDDCGKHPVIWDGKPFCCSGCSTVYQLLNENELCSYYNIESTPGIRVEEGKFKEKYAFLDDEEISSKLYEFSEDAIRKVSLYIPGIHCSSCIWLLEHLNVLNKAVLKSTVNFVKKEVTVTFNSEELSLRELAELLASIHYIPEITLDNLQEKKNQDANKKLLYKIGVAGFSFGNIMLLSLPEYVPGSEYLESHFKSFFGMMNFLLVLPVLFYSGNDYIISAFKGLKHKFINIDVPISLGIITLFIQSSFEIFTSTGSGYMDSLTGLIFFLLIGKWYQSKSYQALSFERDYRSYFPVAVSKIVDDKEESTQINKLKKGDIILIRNQELIPADAILTKGEALIDYSFVTGESKPVFKESGDHIFAGGKQMGSAIELTIEKDVIQSRLTQLWNQFEDENTSGTKLNSLIDKISKYFTFVIIAIGIFAGIYWLLNDSTKAVFAFTSVLIVACPCALALSAPFALGNTMRLMGRLGIYLKSSDVVEKLNSITTIVFDKTGTITQADEVKVSFNGEELSDEDIIAIKSLTRHSTHILSATLYDHFKSIFPVTVSDYKELPSMGISGIVSGREIKLGSAKYIHEGKTETSSLNTEVYLSVDGKIKGHFELSNQYRVGLNKLISDLSPKFDLHVLSGDNDSEMENLKNIFPKESTIKFFQSPNDKLSYINNLKANNKSVLMIGDGLNDAGALKVSDVGISIADDIYHFSPACDAILEASKFQELQSYLKISAKSILIVKLSFALSFLYNIVGLYFAVQGILSPIVAALLMPVSSISVVAFASFTTSYFARNKEKNNNSVNESKIDSDKAVSSVKKSVQLN
ncbi:heavy metal translocating P-type ATPase metal-binding domain-containing protein [Labilibaculum sp. DW002]|uniref:Heavy metal translocating P-type ATPase metal-binding domain-containing protein n=1 Tax=Paralabilibaculum antarcticum TaxID=2912572 RepID=A0ABT5VV81_9BACT|nr:heavy metal translocating P-type ATPase metal-binding domain-containing protein [Labilibaculum sp. DW002]MDE5418214.1 heavy metal translocating P-type ATPase metal-binding domain-containing protein [Labilibaculum sp. DW002]